MTTSSSISPTAYATGYFWFRHGLSTEALVTPQGRRLGRAFGLLDRAITLGSGVSLDAMMLARHRGIDELLTRAIDSGRVQQVIEIAAGLSPRGWSFSKRYGNAITYIETDLPAMAATKAGMLQNAGLLSPQHRVATLDALADSGPNSLAAIAATLNPNLGTAIITEGLMNYLDPAAAQGVWRRIGTTLAGFRHGVYLADIYPQKRVITPALVVLGLLLTVFVRGRMHLHFNTEAEAIARMQASGFSKVEVHAPANLESTRSLGRTKGGNRVRVLEAST